MEQSISSSIEERGQPKKFRFERRGETLIKELQQACCVQCFLMFWDISRGRCCWQRNESAATGRRRPAYASLSLPSSRGQDHASVPEPAGAWLLARAAPQGLRVSLAV